VLRGLHLLGSRTAVMLGLMLATATGGSAARNLWLSFNGTTVEGVVVRQLEELSVDWRADLPGPLGTRRPGIQAAAAERVYRAVVEFQVPAAAGDKPERRPPPHQVIAGATAAVHLYPLGSKVDVVFPPGEPERARLKPELPDFWAQAGLLLVATVVGAGSGYTWWKLARRWASRRRVVKPAE
jgi:hypothetical protein